MCVYKSFITRETTASKDWEKREKKKSETFMQEKNIMEWEGKKMQELPCGESNPGHGGESAGS